MRPFGRHEPTIQTFDIGDGQLVIVCGHLKRAFVETTRQPSVNRTWDSFRTHYWCAHISGARFALEELKNEECHAKTKGRVASDVEVGWEPTLVVTSLRYQRPIHYLVAP